MSERAPAPNFDPTKSTTPRRRSAAGRTAARRPIADRRWPWAPLGFLGLVLVLLALLAVSAPHQALLGVVVVIAALPVYHCRRAHLGAAPLQEASVR